MTAHFTADVPRANAESIRVYGPNATPAEDFEPEYVAVSHDSRTAWVTLQDNNAIALLDVSAGRFTNKLGDADGDGDFDRLYAIGARSFSVRRTDASLLFDSGDQIERVTAAAPPDFFNAGHTTNARDDRGGNKGPEPEGLTVGKAFGRTVKTDLTSS